MPKLKRLASVLLPDKLAFNAYNLGSSLNVSLGQMGMKGLANALMEFNLEWSPDARLAWADIRMKWFLVIDWPQSDRAATKITTEGKIGCLSWSPDGRRIVSTSYKQNCPAIWDAETGQRIRLLEGHTDVAPHVAWSPDGSRILSGSRDRTMRVWDAENGECLNVLEGHTPFIRGLPWSGDSRRVAAGGRTFSVWDAETGECLAVTEGFDRQIMSLALSPDGKRVWAAYDKTMKAWDIESGDWAAEIPPGGGFTNRAIAYAWSPDVKRVVRCGPKPEVWDLESGNCLAELTGYSYRPPTAAWSRDGALLAAASPGNPSEINLWNMTCLGRLDFDNLKGVDLSGLDLSYQDFSKQDLSESNLRGANLAHARLKKTKLNGTDMTGANLDGADLSKSKWSGATCPDGFKIPEKGSAPYEEHLAI